MDNLWRKADKRESEIIIKAQKEHFKGNVIAVIVLYVIVALIFFGIFNMASKSAKERKNRLAEYDMSENEVIEEVDYMSIYTGLCIVSGMCIVAYFVFGYMDSKSYEEGEFIVKYGICTGKRERRSRYTRTCHMNIKSEDEREYNDISVSGFAYDTISVGDRVLLLNADESSDDISKVYAIGVTDNENP